MAGDQGKSINIVHGLSSLPVLEQRNFDGLGKDSITGLRSASEHNIRDSNRTLQRFHKNIHFHLLLVRIFRKMPQYQHYKIHCATWIRKFFLSQDW
jgi:hypothetical protein